MIFRKELTHILWFIFIVISCNDLTSKEKKSNISNSIKSIDEYSEIKLYFKSIDFSFDSSSRSAVVIIPSNICTSCLNILKEYISTKEHSEKTNFILSGRSAKQLRLHFNESIVSHSRVYLDKNAIWNNYSHLLEDEVAVIYYLNDGRIAGKVLLYPHNIRSELKRLLSETESL